MKLQYKAVTIMALFGLGALFLLSSMFYIQYSKIVREKNIETNESIAEELAAHLSSHIEEQARIALTLSSAPIIREALLVSNEEFSAFSDEERAQEVDSLNEQWKNTSDVNDPFIQAHMTNQVAEYLRLQQMILPGLYGEIFLTNRYGAMIATTGKLTTLAHVHKYWWEASYADGQGRIFFDDRGFDASVEGYVLGVVVPIKNGNEIIGILKCNVNIIGPLTDILTEYSKNQTGTPRIVRTGGLVVAEQGVEPLSTQLHNSLIEKLAQKELGSAIQTENTLKQIVSFAPVRITLGSDEYGFGGKHESIDHIKGNEGEAWHFVISSDENEIFESGQELFRVLAFIGVPFFILTTGVAFLFGQWVSKPLTKLATTAQALGEGNLGIRADISSNDEIGTLADTFNFMANELETFTSSLEKKIQTRTEELARSNEELEQFAYIASHDLQAPLRKITAFGGRLQAKYQDVLDERGQDYLARMADSAHRGQQMINDLLELSRVTTQGKPFQKIELNQVIQDVLSDLEVNIEKSGGVVEVDDLPAIEADATQMRQLFQNLIANALKFHKPETPPKVTISTNGDTSGQVQISVADNGIGFEEEFIERIFQPFQRLHGQSEFEGSGIGLSVCQKIVERHRGSIHVNAMLSEGATFVITFPRSRWSPC